MTDFDPSLDYLAFDGLQTVTYYSVTADGAWDGPYTIDNCNLFDSLPVFDQKDAYQRKAGLNIPLPEWFDDAIPAQRGDYLMISENQGTTPVTRKYLVEKADFDQLLQIWRLAIFTQNK